MRIDRVKMIDVTKNRYKIFEIVGTLSLVDRCV